MSKITADFDRIFSFATNTYYGNWQYRWANTPFMEDAQKNGKNESILAHQWGMMSLWFMLRRSCPHLNKVVNSEMIYEGIVHHDIGETDMGDISIVNQMNSTSSKHKAERREVLSLTKELPDIQKKFIIDWFDNFEKDVDSIVSPEILVAKFLDTLQAHLFCLTFGDDLSKHSTLINRIIKMRFAQYTERLIKVLRQKRYFKAADEVIEIANHHLSRIREIGITLSVQNF